MTEGKPLQPDAAAGPAQTPGPPPRLSLEIEHDRRLNWAMQQNSVPLVKLVRLTNDDDRDLEDLVVHVSLSGGLSRPWSRRIDRLPKGSTWNLADVDVVLDGTELAARVERERAILEVRVAARGDGACLAREDREIEILAHNEWSGSAGLPELVAAFVLPNHPQIQDLLVQAAGKLGTRSGSAALDGYQSRDPRRVRAVLKAVHDALAERRISYLTVPASFEDDGQKIRFPEQVLDRGQGNCIDLGAVLAAALEAAGLHPLIAFVEGHAFVGAWLVEDSFPGPCVDDVRSLRNRVQLGELLFFECTGVTQEPPMEFERAVATANRHLEDEARFRHVIDVKAARRARIRPLPARVFEKGARLLDEGIPSPPGRPADPSAAPGKDEPRVATPPGSAAPAEPAAPVGESGPRVEEEPNTRLERWKRRLLDLSLFNRLLNWRDGKRSIPLLLPDLAEFEDQLAGGEAFSMLGRPRIMDGEDPRRAELHEARHGEDPIRDYLGDEIRTGRLHADLPDDELEVRLIEIFRAARSSLEETGSNTLFLAIGFLSWRETPTATIDRLAPILLVPVQLLRSAAGEAIRLRIADEEPRLNLTLVEKLAAEFRIDLADLDVLPEDGSGVDVGAVLRRFREAIKNQPAWEVKEEAVLGLFSFTKFLMWQDLESRSRRLLESPVVFHLVHRPGNDFDDGRAFPEPDRLDDLVHPRDLCCPLDADSSQLAAVIAAVDRKSFVLEGPPGTGKSQTISNLIAQAMVQGQRVLFVSEKRAALEVVHRRLKRAGLEEFCLELHSNKSAKGEVLAQLGAALEAARDSRPSAWEEGAGAVQALRAELNEWVRSMHAPRPAGFSAFAATTRAASLAGAPKHAVEATLIQGMDEERYRDVLATAGRLAHAAVPLEPIAAHPLRAVGTSEYRSGLPDRVRAIATDIAEAARAAIAAWQALSTALELGASCPENRLSRRQGDGFAEFLEFLTNTPGPSRFLLEGPGFVEIKGRAEALIERVRERDRRRDALLERWRESLLVAPVAERAADLAEARESFIALRWFKVRKARQALQPFASGGLPDDLAIARDLEEAASLQTLIASLKDPGGEGRELFGDLWKDGQARPADLGAALAWSARFRGQVAVLAGAGREAAASFSGRMAELAVDRRDLVRAGGPLHAVIHSWLEARRLLGRRLESANKEIKLDVERLAPDAEAEAFEERIEAATREIAAKTLVLDEWCAYTRLRDRALQLGLGRVIEAFEAGEFDAAALPGAMERSLVEAWLDRTTDEERSLREFSARERELAITRFRELDRARIGAATARAREVLTRNLPRASAAETESKGETGVLARQLKLRRNQKPVRKLLREIPNLVFRLKPCFLMSPLSVAQYLDPELPPFDLVVFDEASQIPVWDAVGALARGKSAVIVGDSKQLPPTSFFQRMESTDEAPEEEEVEELESILDECVAARLPALGLRWHYRSRHESLIAFSNHHYYRNALQTFPSAEAKSPRLGVGLVRLPEGSYDKGKTRTNRAEAEALVADIVARLLDVDEPDERKSIGVVTFSQPQQVLVEDLLDAARVANPAIERHFGDEVPEPVFVKNLENVQGDERTIVFFSIGYGRDASGRLSMSFGPLNRDGGERRLNVAITRAREQLVVYSTIGAEDIDLSRTRSVGVAQLKTFLDYAARGPAAIAEALTLRPADAFESPLEEQVARALREKGLLVDTQVGCSGYRIDLAIRDAERPGRYLLGIECDGASYHSAATARDRDRLRQSVLEGLGWRLTRVWSTEWWRRREAVLDRLLREIAEATAHRDAERTAAPAVAKTESAAAAPVAGVKAEAPPENPVAATGPSPSEDPAVHRRLVIDRVRGDGEAFHARASTATLEELASRIIEVEAPIAVDELARRLAAFYGIERLSGRVRDRVQSLVDGLVAGGKAQRVEEFVWRCDQDPRSFTTWRRPGPEADDQRGIELIAIEEIAAAMLAVLRDQFSLDAGDLARESAKALGISRLGSRVQERLGAAVSVLESAGRVRREESRVILAEGSGT